jgi:polyferredoxin
MRKTLIFKSLVQVLSVAAFVWFWKILVFPPRKAPLNPYFTSDGMLAASHTISTWTLSATRIPALVLLLLIFFFGNFFCPWLCPVGGTCDLCRLAVFRTRWRLKIPVHRALFNVRYGILLGILAWALLSLFAPLPSWNWAIDPFVIAFRALSFKGAWLAILGMLVCASIVVPRGWCLILCPVGALYTWVSRLGKKALKKNPGRRA